MLSIVAAVARRGVIGYDNDLPWHLPADLRRFKRLTVGHTVVMGRRTFESILARLGRPLPDRRSVVLTRDETAAWSGVVVTRSIPEALLIARADPAGHGFVIGGAQIYARVLPDVDELLLTEVDADVPGDAYFPPIDERVWTVVERQAHRRDAANPHDYTFVTYRRIRPRPEPESADAGGSPRG